MVASKLCVFLVLIMMCALAVAKKAKDKPDWAKKDIRDYSEADMERLLDQWEVSPLLLIVLIYTWHSVRHAVIRM